MDQFNQAIRNFQQLESCVDKLLDESYKFEKDDILKFRKMDNGADIGRESHNSQGLGFKRKQPVVKKVRKSRFMDSYMDFQELQETEMAIIQWWNFVQMQVRVKMLDINFCMSRNIMSLYKELEKALIRLYMEKMSKLPFIEK